MGTRSGVSFPNHWYAGPPSSRTSRGHTYPLRIARPDIPVRPLDTKVYRNPIIYARELHDEMVREGLTRRQLAERHGISSDRVTQWLCLLELPPSTIQKLVALGDNWDRQLITERTLRAARREKE